MSPHKADKYQGYSFSREYWYKQQSSSSSTTAQNLPLQRRSNRQLCPQSNPQEQAVALSSCFDPFGCHLLEAFALQAKAQQGSWRLWKSGSVLAWKSSFQENQPPAQVQSIMKVSKGSNASAGEDKYTSIYLYELASHFYLEEMKILQLPSPCKIWHTVTKHAEFFSLTAESWVRVPCWPILSKNILITDENL